MTMDHALSASFADKAASRVRWRIFLVMLFLIAINYIDRASLSVAMPLIAKEFDMDPATQGLILSGFFWTYALMQIPGGMLADRFKPRIVIACATLGLGLLPGDRGGVRQLGGSAADPSRPGGCGGADLPGRRQAQRDLDDAERTRPRRHPARWRRSAGCGTGCDHHIGADHLSRIVAAGLRRRRYRHGAGRTVRLVLHPQYAAGTSQRQRGRGKLHRSGARRGRSSTAVSGSGRVLDFFRYRSVWGMFFGWMCFNSVFYGLLTWMPNYLYKVHGFDIKQMGGASFIIFFSGFVGELVGGWICDQWKAKGGSPNLVMRTLFGLAAIIATLSIFTVAYTSNPIMVVVLLSTTLFFLRWCGLYWCIPSMIANRNRVGFLGGTMNLGGNIGGIMVPVLVGLIVQTTGSYFLALMFFAAAGVGLLLCSTSIDYSKKLPV